MSNELTLSKQYIYIYRYIYSTIILYHRTKKATLNYQQHSSTSTNKQVSSLLYLSLKIIYVTLPFKGIRCPKVGFKPNSPHSEEGSVNEGGI